MKDVHVTEELDDKLAHRAMEDLLRCASLLDTPLVHDDHAIGHFESFFLIVGDKHTGHVKLVVQAAKPATQFLANPSVQCSEGLIQQQQLGFDRQSRARATR